MDYDPNPDDYDIPESPMPLNTDNMEPDDHLFRQNTGYEPEEKRVIFKRRKLGTGPQQTSEPAKTPESRNPVIPDTPGITTKAPTSRNRTITVKRAATKHKATKPATKKLTVDCLRRRSQH